ncbi:hypothetical protein AB0C18_21050 [Nonomuraea muscovyensis]|uniref:hypothetical protein n=1 Tax=Nonomuraea muscovyensis TaxID=1124761 RepID=UPI0033FDFAEC
MATAAQTAINPMRDDGEAADVSQAPVRAAAALQEAAKETHSLRAMGELTTMTDWQRPIAPDRAWGGRAGTTAPVRCRPRRFRGTPEIRHSDPEEVVGAAQG